MVRFSYSKPSAVACTGFGGEPNEEKAELPGNEASLNFVSLRSLCNFVGRLGPSRVKINALRAPLTALPVRGGCVCVFQFLVCFSLDRDRKSTRLNSSHANISYAVFCLK